MQLIMTSIRDSVRIYQGMLIIKGEEYFILLTVDNETDEVQSVNTQKVESGLIIESEVDRDLVINAVSDHCNLKLSV